MESILGWIGLRRPAKVVHAKTDASSSRQKLMPADAGLASLPDGVLAIVGQYLALPSRVLFAAALPSAGVQAVVPPGSVSVLDFEEVEKELAMRLSDDDLGAILACLACAGAHTLHKLKLANCLNITGRGLEPMRGSTALQVIDLSLVGQFESPEIEGGLLSEAIVIPILQSIIDTEGNGLRYLALPHKWKAGESQSLTQFHRNYAEHLYTAAPPCSGKSWRTGQPCDHSIGPSRLHPCSDCSQAPCRCTLAWFNDGHNQGYTCYDCGAMYCEDCEEDGNIVSYCERCQKEYCDDCSSTWWCDFEEGCPRSGGKSCCSGCLPMNACSRPRCDINCCLECASLTKCDACGEGTCKFCREEGYIKTCDHCNRTLCLKCCTTRYCYCPYNFCSRAICTDCHPVGWECTWCSEYTEYLSDKYEKYAPRCTQCFENAKTHCNGCGRKKLRDEDYSAPPVPSSYWIALGYDEANVERMEKFLQEVKLTTLKLRSGEELECGITLKGGSLDPNGLILRHDNILLPHWQELANAIRQYTHEPGYHDVFRLSDVELHSSVVHMLTLALKQKNKPLEVHNCPSSTNGIDFAVKYAQSNPGLKRLHWGGTRVDTAEILRRLFDIVDSHPSLNSFSLNSICGERMNGHDLLPLAFSLLHGTKTYNIGLRSNNIRTNGATDLPDFVATNNPHLKSLDLMDNNFDDGDALRCLQKPSAETTPSNELISEGTTSRKLAAKLFSVHSVIAPV